MTVDLSTAMGPLTLRCPVMLGSGTLGAKGDKLLGFSKVAGAVVTKSISLEPHQGNSPPRIVRIDHDGIINSERSEPRDRGVRPNPSSDKARSGMSRHRISLSTGAAVR